MRKALKLPAAAEALRRGLLAAYHSGGRAWLFTPARSARSETLDQIFRLGRGLMLLVSDGGIADLGLPSPPQGDGGLLSCTFSPAGLKALKTRLCKRRARALEGPDKLPWLFVSENRLLQNHAAEARLMEACLSLKPSHPLAFCAALLAPTGEPYPEDRLHSILDREGIPLLSEEDLKLLRLHHRELLQPAGVSEIALLSGTFKLHSFFSEIDQRYHWAFTHGDFPGHGRTPPLVRLESECLTGHVLGSRLCDCGVQLERALERIHNEGRGALVYLRQEGRGIGLLRKLQAYHLQQRRRMDTVDANLALGLPADARDYLIGAQILHRLGVRTVRLLTNNPRKVAGLERYGILVSERLPHKVGSSSHNRRYLQTKKARLGHLL